MSSPTHDKSARALSKAQIKKTNQKPDSSSNQFLANTTNYFARARTASTRCERVCALSESFQVGEVDCSMRWVGALISLIKKGDETQTAKTNNQHYFIRKKRAHFFSRMMRAFSCLEYTHSALGEQLHYCEIKKNHEIITVLKRKLSQLLFCFSIRCARYARVFRT